MSNKSGIHPAGHRILVKTLKIEEVSSGGIIISHGKTTVREEMAETTGIVIEVGPDACDWSVVGDKVTYAKYAGMLYMGRDGEKYRIMNDEDVTAVLDPDMGTVDLGLVHKKGYASE